MFLSLEKYREVVRYQKVLQVQVEKHRWSITGSLPFISNESKHEMKWNEFVNVSNS